MRLIEAGERAGDLMDIAPALVDGDGPAMAVDPGDGLLDDPPVPVRRPAVSMPYRAMRAEILGGRLGGHGGGRRPRDAELVGLALSSTSRAVGGQDAAWQLRERHAVVGVGVGHDEGGRMPVRSFIDLQAYRLTRADDVGATA